VVADGAVILEFLVGRLALADALPEIYLFARLSADAAFCPYTSLFT
jgi:hypothetical protein